ncbi:MAG: putative transcriptional regulator, Crp/Fnr family [Marmoricola sp.]|nr:putative transcriptional regulator, Crp/Fnr family [Marmoricola sp.]
MFRHDQDNTPHESLRAVPGLSDEDAETVWSQGRVVTVPAGWSMVHEKEPPDSAYLILEGRVEVTLNKQSVTELGPGDFVGEIGPIARRLRTATVTAREPLLTLTFPAADFVRVRRDVPSFDQAVTEIAEARIREIDGDS